MTVIVARLMWLLPLLLLLITGFLVRAGLNQKETLEAGELTAARVLDVEIRNRADITYGHIDLRIEVRPADSIDARLPLPLSLLMSVSDEPELEVRMLKDANQPIVIERIAHAQWRMSLINASMCLLGAILLTWAVFGWNRYLKKEGDPALRSG